MSSWVGKLVDLARGQVGTMRLSYQYNGATLSSCWLNSINVGQLLENNIEVLENKKSSEVWTIS